MLTHCPVHRRCQSDRTQITDDASVFMCSVNGKLPRVNEQPLSLDKTLQTERDWNAAAAADDDNDDDDDDNAVEDDAKTPSPKPPSPKPPLLLLPPLPNRDDIWLLVVATLSFIIH